MTKKKIEYEFSITNTDKEVPLKYAESCISSNLNSKEESIVENSGDEKNDVLS